MFYRVNVPRGYCPRVHVEVITKERPELILADRRFPRDHSQSTGALSNLKLQDIESIIHTVDIKPALLFEDQTFALTWLVVVGEWIATRPCRRFATKGNSTINATYSNLQSALTAAHA